jgi:hypothetical protein
VSFETARAVIRDTRACISFCRSCEVRQFHSRLTVFARFIADTMSDVPIVVCYCLLRFANRVAMKSNRDETGVAASHKHGRQSPWRPSERELGIRTIEESPGSSQFE